MTWNFFGGRWVYSHGLWRLVLLVVVALVVIASKKREREREREIDYKLKKIKKEYLNKVGKNKTFNVWCIIKCGVK